MSDIDNNSYGRETETSSWDGIRVSLTEMERRLGELQSQLNPQLQDQTGPQPREAAAVVSGSSAGLAGAVAPARIAGAVATSAGFHGAMGAGFVSSPFDSDLMAQQQGEEILADARAAAREVLASAEAQVGLVKQQIEQLLAAREALKGSLRAALVECDGALQRLEHGEQPSRPDAGERTSAHRLHPISGGVEFSGGVAVPFAAGGVPHAQVKKRAPEVPSVFEGSVSLRVGPLQDISQVDTLEIALLQVPGAEQVEVKEFAGRDAVAVVKLFQPVPLVEELRRVLPFQFEVLDSGEDTLTLIAVENGDAGRLADPTGSLPADGVE